jgi:hypothetical protein
LEEKEMKTLILSILLFSQISFAVCNKPVTYLTEGKPAPCNGYLFTPEQEKQVREDVFALGKYKELVKMQDDLVGTLNERIDNYEFMTENLRSENEFIQKKNTWMNGIYFVLGITVGIVAQRQLGK